MIRLTEKLDSRSNIAALTSATLSLPIEMRVRSRAKVLLDDGREAGLFLPRGQLLRGGDILKSEDGIYIKVIAAPETVSTATTDNPLALMKAAYHLGNRHVPLQIEQDFLRYRHDHILDAMLEQMGLIVIVSQQPFEPEAGAYQQTGHSHSHEHSH